ncbi:MAG: hypothetical protein ACKVX7_09990 [Planctomycetota bacterium]
MTPAIDLVVNVFERTYRRVLAPGWFDTLIAAQCRSFAQRVVLINNVDDVAAAGRSAETRRRAGEIDAYYFVRDQLPAALAGVGLSTRDLGRIPHYTDWAVVAVAMPGNPWLVHWDAEAALVAPSDWVTPSIELMERDPRVAVANPSWRADWDERDGREFVGDFALGGGFSDQVFLVRREEFARPIYGHWSLASWRYPLTHVARIFEARVDAYLRATQRLRATHLRCIYRHESRPAATASLGVPRSGRERLAKIRRRLAIHWLRWRNGD